MKSIGSEQYAVCAVLGGLQGWYLLSDLGIGVSLQNHISELRAKNESYQGFIAATGLLALLLFFIFAALLFVITPFVAPVILKKFEFLSQVQKSANFLVVGVLSILFSIGGISYKIWYAEQKGYLANLLPAVASVASLCWLILLSHSQATDKLFWSLVASFAPIAIIPILVLIRKTAAALTCEESIDPRIVRPLLKRALKFWGFGIMAAGVLQIDYIMMSQFLKASDIVVYTMCTKVFGLLFFVYNAVILAIWPVFAEAIATGNWDTVKRKTKLYILLGMGLMALSTAALVLFMPFVVSVLSPKERIEVPASLILVFGLYYMVRIWTDTYAMVLQSMSFLRPFWVFVPFQALLSVSLQWILIPIMGLHGVLFGLIGSFLLTVTWALPVVTYRQATLSENVKI